MEWDNALASGNARARAGLAAVNRQLWALVGRAEGEADVVVTCDAEQVSIDRVRACVREAGGARGWPGRVAVVEAPPGCDYYRQKNFGFRHTRNAVVIFLDSDLLPEDDWLEQMASAMRDYRVAVAVGNTYLDTDTFYARCVGLFWIFDARSTERDVRRTPRLVSNNIAFRRGVFARFPFPERPTYRGQCSELGGMLARHGIGIHLNPAAQAAHPPPNGVLRFVERAMFAGHDECRYRAWACPVHLGDALARYGVDVRAVRRRISERQRAIGAGTVNCAAALGLGVAYYSLKLVAYLATLVSPTLVRRLFPA